MPTLPGQLCAAAPAFVPTPAAHNNCLQQPQSAQISPRAAPAKPFLSDKFRPTSYRASASLTTVFEHTDAPRPPAPNAGPPPAASYADALHADAARTLAISLGLLSARGANGRWGLADPKEKDLVVHISSMLRLTGEPETRQLLLAAKMLLPHSPCVQDVLQAIGFVQDTPKQQRQELGSICYRMCTGFGDRNSRLWVAHQLKGYRIEQVSFVDEKLFKLYQFAGAPMPAVRSHWQLCAGLASLGAGAGGMGDTLLAPRTLSPGSWPKLLQQWQKSAPGHWFDQLQAAIVEKQCSDAADQLVLGACMDHCVCLPAALEAAIAADLALPQTDATLAPKALDTTARLLRPMANPKDAVALRIWTIARALNEAEQNQLVTCMEALYPSATTRGNRLASLEQLAAMPHEALGQAFAVLQELTGKAATPIEPKEQLVLLSGIVALQAEMAAVQSICQDPDLSPEDVAKLLRRFVDMPPDAWLGEARCSLATAQEFVTIDPQDVPNAAACDAPKPQSLAYRLFPTF